MKPGIPLLGRIIGWLLLNLAALAALLAVLVRQEVGLEPLMAGMAGERSQRAADVLLAELRERQRPEWDAALARFAEAYGVHAVLVREDGTVAAGEGAPPPAVVARLRPGPPPRGPRYEGGGEPAFPPEDPRPPGGPRRGMPPTPRAFLRAGEPPRYWLVAGGFVPEGGPRRPLRLVLSSESISGGGLFLDPIPWLWAGSGVLVFSVLWWLPFVRGITRAVSRMTAATERIAEGRFDAAAPEERSDELGRLGAAINRMATRLDGFVHGQKRFLGDVAHELCTPLARMEMALGVLEQRADAASMDYVRDVREEVRHMSGLVDELLQFSKAGLKPRDLPLVAVPLRALAQRVVGREAPDDPRVRVEVPDGLAALGDPDLLARGLGNLVRNALRHAGGHGPITIAAIPAGDAVRLEVADGGPGVPPDHLARLGEPFFRPDPARTREGGGAGLGLAIVKTCAAACRGRLELRNGADRGLVAALVLGRAPSGEP